MPSYKQGKNTILIPKWKVIFSVLVCVFGLIYAIPNVLPESFYEVLPDWVPHKKINLGLDLQGGSHLLLEVDVKAALKDRLSTLVDDVRKKLRKNKIGYTGLEHKGGYITLTLMDASRGSEALSLLSSLGKEFEVAQDKERLSIRYGTSESQRYERAIVEQSREIVERRINEFGLAEPNIQIQGQDRILVQLPGLKDPQRLKELLGQTAKMTFHLVPEEPGSKGTVKLPYNSGEGSSQDALSVFKEALLDGSCLVDAQPELDENHRPRVHFRMDTMGAKKFSEITRQNVGHRFAIVLDNRVIVAPVIRGVIPGGVGVIEGHFTLKQSQDLALLMRAGALPAPLKPIEERSVGPDLGADSISSGKIATVTSILFVSLMMLMLYAFFGILANVAVIFNVILIVAAASVLGATLTLAGIAGIALTIGMAVDANILIYERIKEELRLGRSVMEAVEAGYDRAMTTIIDSNLTTLIAAAVMFYYGSGPIRGFAITLSLGLVISMFTAITLTRVLAAWWLNKRRPQRLSI